MRVPAYPGVRAGCDVVDVEAFATRLRRTPGLLERLFTPGEVADARRGGAVPGSIVEVRRLAARAAAKEAAYKALGIPGLAFRDVEVRLDVVGAPHLFLRGEPCRASVSLSHDGPVAIALVVAPHDAATARPSTADHDQTIHLDPPMAATHDRD